jgi:hypothetical protein
VTMHFTHLGEIFKDRLEEHVNIHIGKFVQIRHQDLGEFIVFAPKELCVFHAEIVDLFCSLQEPAWAFSLSPKNDDGTLYEEKGEVVGGGYYELLNERRRLNLEGQSLAFGDYDNFGLGDRLRGLSRFSEFKIFG